MQRGIRFKRTRVTREEAGIVAPPADWGEVAAVARELPVSQAALCLSLIGLVLYSVRDREAAQRSVLSMVRSAKVRDAIGGCLGTGDSVLALAEPSQIVAAWRELAFAARLDDPRIADPSVAEARFWQWLMMISEAIEGDMRSKIPRRVGLTSDEALSVIAAGSHVETRDLPNSLLARTYEVLNRTATQLAVSKRGMQIDLSDEIARAEGFDWRDLLAMAMSVVSRVDPGSNDANESTEPFDGLEPNEFFPNGFDRGEAQRFIELMSGTLTDLRRAYEDLGSRHTYPPDWLPLARRPLIRLPNGRYCVTLPQFVFERFSLTGIYHVLAGTWRKRTGKATNAFTHSWGRLLESYVDSLFEAVYPRQAGDRKLWLDQDLPYKVKKKQYDPTDIMLDGGDTLVLFEVTTSGIGMKAKTRADAAAFREDLRKVVLCKAAQLHRVIRDFRDGCFKLGAADASRFSKFLPVIVSWEAVPMFAPTTEYIQQTLQMERILSDPDTLPCQVLSLQECEGLLGAVARGEVLLDVLMQKIGSPNHCYGSFIDFRIATGKPISALDHPVLYRALGELWDRSTVFLFGPSTPALGPHPGFPLGHTDPEPRDGTSGPGRT